jgi:DnaD/phage-associated family protein
MAERRMFAKTIIDSDAFLDMSLSAQALYFHLSMRGDDEGFVNNPKKIQRMIGASDDDAKILVAKKFIIPFESGIVVIKHWKIHNYIRGDRLVETKYKEERSLLELDENGAYTSIANDEQLALSAKDKRKHAYEVSSLPYSFEYKIRHAFTGHECPVCGCTMTHENNLVQPTIQHNIPISKGGEHELGNISVICRSCNTSIRDKETGELNSREVAETWDKICELESHGIDWFKNTALLCQSSDGQVTDISQPTDSIGKVRLGKVSIDKSRLVESRNEQTDELSSLIEFCNNNVEILTPFKMQMLEGYVDDYGIEWVQKGLEKVAGMDRTKQNVKYLGGVLNGWKKDGDPKPWEDSKEVKQAAKIMHDDVGEYELIDGYKVYL